MTVGVGIVGCGLIGEKRARAMPAGTRLIGVHDIEVSRAKALASDLDDPGLAVATLAELLDREELDLVVVATVHDQLLPVALAALEAGRQVLVEKPGSRDRSSLEVIRDEAASRGLVVRVGYNHRFHPSFVKLRQLHAARDDGEPMFIRARYGHGGRLGYDKEWRTDRRRSGGGELVDQGSHLIDLSLHLLGGLQLVFAELPTMFWSMEVEDNAFLALRAGSGSFAWLHASWTEWKNLFSFEISYRRAKYEITGLGGSYGLEQLTLHAMRPELGPPDSQTWAWPAPDDSWRLELEDVLAVLNGRPGVGASIEDGIATLAIIEEAYRS